MFSGWQSSQEVQKMKKILFIIVVLFTLFIPPAQSGYSASMDELTDQYNKQYDALKPPSNYSSVRSDYVFEQTALSTQQTTKILELIYEQNRQMLSRYDEMLNKYDEIIKQNNEIIKLLSKNGSKDETKK
jgi:hypothetical protein